MAMYIVKPWYRKKDDAIYGAEWAGTSDPSWVRTDAAVGFANPNPYYAGMSTTPSSPFDNIMPWAGMRRVTDSVAGELVEIPKFYYKWTRNGTTMKLQISMQKHDGFFTSPAHADRDDGLGERNYVYIGRYLCASDYKSKTNSSYYKTNCVNSRSGIRNLRSDTYQYDITLWWTIVMLYLVEYAHWNASLKIGIAKYNGGTTGLTDSMPYHTGTISSSREVSNATQYRYIEYLYGLCQWLDGIYFADYVSSSRPHDNVYIIKNPANFSNSSGGVKLGARLRENNVISAWSPSPSAAGLEYALKPSSLISDSSGKTYTTGQLSYGFGGDALMNCVGLFSFATWAPSNGTSDYWALCRLMVLPPSRLSA